MPDVVLVSAISAADLLATSLDANIGSTATSLPASSNSITASRTQRTRQPQESFSNSFHHQLGLGAGMALPVHDLDADGDSEAKVLATASLSYNIPASSTSTAIDTRDEGDSETAHHNAQIHSMPTFPSIFKVPCTALEPSITVDNLNPETSSSQVFPANSTSTDTPIRPIDTQLGPVLGTRTITASSKSEHTSPSSQNPSLGSTSTLGSSIPTSVLAPSDFITPVPAVVEFAIPLSPLWTDFVKSAPALTIGTLTVTVNDQGHYLLNNQTLTRAGVITVSSIKMSNTSDVIVGTSTEALHPAFTAGLGSGANGTEVQKFRGDALGVRDGVWNSSLMLLVSFFVLLWL